MTIYRHDSAGGAIVHLSSDEPRCVGKPAGPSGHQIPEECASCFRRLAPRAGYPLMEAPSESPCSQKVDV